MNKNLSLHVPRFEDSWFELQFPGHKEKYIFAVIYCHPHSNSISFISMFDEKLNTLNKKQKKVFVFGDIKFDLSSPKLFSQITDYIQIIESKAFSNLFMNLTYATSTSQTTIDHILSNDGEFILTCDVFNYVISDNFAICCNIQNSNFSVITPTKKHTFQNIHSTDRTLFCNDLELSLTFINKSIKVTHNNNFILKQF